MSFGPNPWQQQHWDARAAGNFMAGGAGAGLVVAAALAGGPAWAPLLGAALVGLGLGSVALELGRPLRALNVVFNARTSWMTREAFAALALFAAVGAWWLFGWPAAVVGAVGALAAIAFVYCQGRLLRAARGIPAWREPLTAPLIVATGLAEGAGLYVTLTATVAPPLAVALLLAAALAARLGLWIAWRKRLRAAPRALLEIDRAGHLFKGLTLAALALCIVASLAPPVPLLTLAWPVAGLAALAGGLWFKFTLVLRGAFNQGFALPHLPVRGVPHVGPG